MGKFELTSKQPKEILEVIGSLFESSRKHKDLQGLYKSIELANAVDTNSFDLHSKAILFYFISNAWSYVQNLKFPREEFPLETSELDNQILYLRKAYDLIKKCDDNFVKRQILTNLGNLFSHIGRFSEAQEYFNFCLEINDHFGMAIGNRGIGLFYYARVIFDPGQQFIFMQCARKDLLKSLSAKDVYPEAKKAFYSIIEQIEKAYTKDQLDKFEDYNDFNKDLKTKEKEYREWCASNRLFINPLNDVMTESIVAHDYLFVPPMITGFNEKPFYHSLFNQLKQEFVSSRFLFFESLFKTKAHFSDKQVVLMNTLDYSVYSFSLEKTKISYRVCYSLFDKIAYFINLYLKLEQDLNRVNFRNVWYNKSNKKNGLNNKLLITKNWAMRGLFWLSKDLEEKGFDSPIEPEAKDIATIRNFIEHKSFKIVESFNSEWTAITETYEIKRSLFNAKTLKILKLSRSALMYLSFLIYDEENQRRKTKGNKLSLPMHFIKLDDEWKI